MSVPHDMTGREIKVGDEIAYASLLGRSAALSRGEILEIIRADDDYRGKPTFKFKIQRKENDGSIIMKQKFIYDPDGTNGGSRHVDTVPSTSTLKFQERLVVISN